MGAYSVGASSNLSQGQKLLLEIKTVYCWSHQQPLFFMGKSLRDRLLDFYSFLCSHPDDPSSVCKGNTQLPNPEFVEKHTARLLPNANGFPLLVKNHHRWFLLGRVYKERRQKSALAHTIIPIIARMGVQFQPRTNVHLT